MAAVLPSEMSGGRSSQPGRRTQGGPNMTLAACPDPQRPPHRRRTLGPRQETYDRIANGVADLSERMRKMEMNLEKILAAECREMAPVERGSRARPGVAHPGGEPPSTPTRATVYFPDTPSPEHSTKWQSTWEALPPLPGFPTRPTVPLLSTTPPTKADRRATTDASTRTPVGSAPSVRSAAPCWPRQTATVDDGSSPGHAEKRPGLPKYKTNAAPTPAGKRPGFSVANLAQTGAARKAAPDKTNFTDEDHGVAMRRSRALANEDISNARSSCIKDELQKLCTAITRGVLPVPRVADVGVARTAAVAHTRESIGAPEMPPECH